MLTVAIYRETRRFPRTELYGLRKQLRSAGVSVPANIAEGSRRGSDADFARFLRISLGSASELDYYLLLARELGFLGEAVFTDLAEQNDEVMRMLRGLIHKLGSS